MERREYELMYLTEENHWWFKGKRKIILSQLENALSHKRKLRILDIGCGTGIMMKNFERYGTAFGMDIETTALNFCLKRGIKNIAHSNVAMLPFKTNSFDVVGIFDVIYHKGVKNDVEALKEIYRIVKPKGMLILTDSADMKLWSRHDIAAHARERYSLPKLASRLESSGFKIKRITYFNTILYPLVFIARKWDNLFNKNKVAASNIKKTSPLLNLILYNIFVLESKLLKILNLPFGVSILAIAEK